jgi:hypothetical protein
MGVDELQIVDDIFNMNPPRMKPCAGLSSPTRCTSFPNGLRFDILDEEGHALVRAGRRACVAIETITPGCRTDLKHLRVERQAIRWMADRGVLIRGFFMLGFPTETVAEIESTIDYAVKSGLAQAYFFNVVPQPGTPLYDLAYQENAAALESQTLQEYNAKTSFYNAAYGVNMLKIMTGYFRFYVLTQALAALVRMMPWRISSASSMGSLRFFRRKRIEDEPLPEELLPLSRLYAADDVALTSAQIQRKKAKPQGAHVLS